MTTTRMSVLSGVRSFTPGTRFTLTGSPLDAQLALPGADPQYLRDFLLTGVIAVGLNNLPGSLSPELVQLRDDAQAPGRGTPSRRQRTAASVLPGWVSPSLRRQAAKSGYANRFAASRVRVPWVSPPTGLAYFADAAPEDVDCAPSLAAPRDRLAPSLEDLSPDAEGSSAVLPVGQAPEHSWRDDWSLLIPASALPLGQPLYPKAGARVQDLPGTLLATIVDASGNGTSDQQAHMDALGRVRVRFDFQQGLDSGGSTTRTSPWVRVAQVRAFLAPVRAWGFLNRAAERQLTEQRWADRAEAADGSSSGHNLGCWTSLCRHATCLPAKQASCSAKPCDAGTTTCRRLTCWPCSSCPKREVSETGRALQ